MTSIRHLKKALKKRAKKNLAYRSYQKLRCYTIYRYPYMGKQRIDMVILQDSQYVLSISSFRIKDRYNDYSLTEKYLNLIEDEQNHFEGDFRQFVYLFTNNRIK